MNKHQCDAKKFISIELKIAHIVPNRFLPSSHPLSAPLIAIWCYCTQNINVLLYTKMYSYVDYRNEISSKKAPPPPFCVCLTLTECMQMNYGLLFFHGILLLKVCLFFGSHIKMVSYIFIRSSNSNTTTRESEF